MSGTGCILLNAHQPGVSSWGGSVIHDGKGTYHMFAPGMLTQRGQGGGGAARPPCSPLLATHFPLHLHRFPESGYAWSASLSGSDHPRFVEEIVNGCGLNTYARNMRVAHAVATDPAGETHRRVGPTLPKLFGQNPKQFGPTFRL